MQAAPLRRLARAKINLGLKVVGRRPDGYHDIVSVFQSVDLADELHFEPASEDGLTCSDPALSVGPDNLVRRATAAFRAAGGGSPVHIHLDKRIPTGSGLGGGSADAASTLTGLNELAGHPLDAAALSRLGAVLGSDVPFALGGGTALVTGRGERLAALDWEGPAPCFVLVYPGVEVSTAWAYRHLDLGRLTGPSPYLSFLDSLCGGRLDGWRLLSVLENDFLPLVEGAKPIVAEVRSQLCRLGARVSSMSGSGSTVYGVFDDRSAAQKACSRLVEGGHRSFFCEPVFR
ncbi:MAG: 4-(cytidine 5'-diphospho)-2-C-methyl-D-erythritol kinase [Gemmatimonadota bacterium]